MPESPAQAVTQAEVVDLKDPVLAAFLAWLIPGLGHWYQGRRAKAALFFICIMGTFAYGLYLGGNREVGWGRTVYFSWEWRLAPFCQVGVGAPVLPALLQANRMANHQPVWWQGFLAPPRPSNEPGPEYLQHSSVDREQKLQRYSNVYQPTLNDLHRHLHRFYELGTVFTMIGGLLNILAICDAWGGPFIAAPKKDEKTAPDKKADEAQPKSGSPPSSGAQP